MACSQGLNKMLEITVPKYLQEGGTYVIPGHGRISDEADVVEYRDMVYIVRDRIQDMVKTRNDARTGESGQTHARLRRALRRGERRRNLLKPSTKF